MLVRSKAYVQNQIMDKKYVYDKWNGGGENISPDVSWEDIPPDTKSIAITIFDPDAPKRPERREGGWWHWVVFNIPGHVSEIREGISKTSQMPDGAVESKTDYNAYGYNGPCPPVGDAPHHYELTVYALKETLALDKEATFDQVKNEINRVMLDSGRIVSLYKR